MIFFELFYTFFYIGLFTFGGGYAMIPLIEEQIKAHEIAWGVSSEILTDFIAVSESTPGPFAINIATFIGSQAGGIFGAVCATVGVILPSFIIILLIAMIMKRIMKNRFVKGALAKVGPVIIALITYTAINFFLKMFLYQGHAVNSCDIAFDRASLAIFLMVGLFTIIYKKEKKKGLNPILILLLSAVLGIIVFQ
ncbi:MAG: chromate transporter [Bacilli bacterium]|nr:chromate transporter [Bacilli bacterium]